MNKFRIVTVLIAVPLLAAVVSAQTASSAKAVAAKKIVSAPSKTKGAAAAAQGGVMVFIDPVTKEIRQPTAEEMAAMTAAPAARSASRLAGPQVVAHEDGSESIDLGDSMMAFTVVTKTADGKLKMDCVTGSKAAEAKLKAAPAKTVMQTGKKEVPDVQ